MAAKALHHRQPFGHGERLDPAHAHRTDRLVAKIGDDMGGAVIVAVELFGERHVELADEAGGADRESLQRFFIFIANRMSKTNRTRYDNQLPSHADLDRIRSKEKEIAAQEGIKLTYLPYVIQATLDALKAHPYLNATLDDEREEILLKKFYNVGIAVDTADGLIVFAIKRADQKSLLDLAQEISTLAEKARTAKIGPFRASRQHVYDHQLRSDRRDLWYADHQLS